MPKDMTPIYERGRKPQMFQRYLALRVIHVTRYRKRGLNEPLEYWLQECRPISADRPIVAALLAGAIDPYSVDFRPRRPRSWRLLYRAVQEMQQGGNPFRASQLANRAVVAAIADFDLAIIDVARGLELDILGGHENTGSVPIWLEQADWWAGGKWEGSGRLGNWLDEVTRPLLERMKEEGQLGRKPKRRRPAIG